MEKGKCLSIMCGWNEGMTRPTDPYPINRLTNQSTPIESAHHHHMHRGAHPRGHADDGPLRLGALRFLGLSFRHHLHHHCWADRGRGREAVPKLGQVPHFPVLPPLYVFDVLHLLLFEKWPFPGLNQTKHPESIPRSPTPDSLLLDHGLRLLDEQLLLQVKNRSHSRGATLFRVRLVAPPSPRVSTRPIYIHPPTHQKPPHQPTTPPTHPPKKI